MDEKLKELIETASPHDEDDKSYDDMGTTEEMKQDIAGGKARYVFTCRGCGNEVVTQNAYYTADNMLLDNMKVHKSFIKERFYRWIIRPIPFLGRFLFNRAERRMRDKEEANLEGKENKARYKAWEEVKELFQPCSRCGTYACPECYKDGLCGNCYQIQQAQQEVNQAKS